jgi:PAS domain S-box-containing protein
MNDFRTIPTRPLRGLAGHGFALGAVGAAFLIRYLLEPYLGNVGVYLTFFLAIVFVVQFTGVSQTVLAISVSLLLVHLFFMPEPRLKVQTPEILSAVFFVIASAAAGFFAMTGRAAAIRQHETAVERMRAEEALEREQQQLRMAHQRLTSHMENSPIAVIEFDPELRLAFWSRAASEIFGWEASEVLGKSMWELPWVHPEDREQVQSISASMLLGGKGRTISPNRNLRKDGQIVWCEWYNSALTDERGEIQSILSLVLDVTERTRAQAALQESESRFRAMADGTPLIIWVHDPAGTLQFVNRAWCSFFGIPPDEVQHCDWRQLVHPEDFHGYVEEFSRCNRERRVFSARTRVRRHDGEWRCIESQGEPRFSHEGHYLGIAGSSIDVTDRVNFMSELERQVDLRTQALQKTTEQLNSFCYTIAHDLKAPLRAQHAFASILADEFSAVLREEGTEYARRIAESALKQSRLIDDLLAHLSVTRAELPLDKTDLHQAVEMARAELTTEFNRRQSVFETDGSRGTVLANAASLHVVLVNLFSNALKFVPKSRVPRVRVRTESCGERLRLCVEDNGIGIDPRFQPKLFHIFQRLHSDPEYPGTGIGLAIVKESVERMGGVVGFESEVGVGSRFWIELRRAEAVDAADGRSVN